MKKRSLFSLALLLAGVLLVQEGRAQDYTRFGTCPKAPSPAWAKAASVGVTERWPIPRTARGWRWPAASESGCTMPDTGGRSRPHRYDEAGQGRAFSEVRLRCRFLWMVRPWQVPVGTGGQFALAGMWPAGTGEVHPPRP